MNKVFIVAVPSEVGSTNSILGCPVIFSGVGKINATRAVSRAFYLGYSEIVNIGSCGSLNHPFGELFSIGKVFHDIDGTPLIEYGKIPFEENSGVINLDANNSVSCFTTDYFYDKTQRDKYSKNYINMINKCSVFDMECFALAFTSKQLGIKFSSYKWVSDNGNASSWEENCKVGFEKFKNLYK
jgi:nucleoside phosphorylase